MYNVFMNTTNVPAFLVKLWKLVEDPSTNELITWNQNGSSFIITDNEKFARELLPLYFKHNNTASFIRQLNLYGFKKVINYEKANDSREMEFQHSHFSRDKIELLANIKRRIASSRSIEQGGGTVGSDLNPKDILTNLTTLREKQKKMDSTLTQMKKENEILWREISTVRQRHKAQEQVLHKVIQFLVQIIQRSNQNIHVPRKLARMLQDSSVSQENSSQVARIVDAIRNKDSDYLVNSDESSNNSVGAVIHEVTDMDCDAVANSEKLPSIKKSNISVLKPLNSSENNTFSMGSVSTTPSLDTLSILENLHKKETSTLKKSTENNAGHPMKFVAVPLNGDPSKLILVPADKFSNEELSSFSKDSLCNIIALPDKESEKVVSSTPAAESNHINDNITNYDSSLLDVFNESIYSDKSELPNKLSDVRIRQDFDDSLLSDMLKASKISSNADETDAQIETFSPVSDLPVTEGKLDEKALENSNNQLAIPGPSSIVKSTKNYFNDFNLLTEPSTNSTSTIDMKLFEQLFNSHDGNESQSLTNQLQDEISMSQPSDDIIGNELVQFTPTIVDINEDINHLLLDIFNQDSYNPELDLTSNLYCGPKDFDVLIHSNNDALSDLEVVKKETLLTNPQRTCNEDTKNNKRRRVK